MYRFTLSTNLKLKYCSFLPNYTKYKPTLLSKAMYLDTETSHNHDTDNPIGWIESLCYEFNDEIVILRKPSEFINCLKQIKKYYKLTKKKQMVIFVHNLAYDMQYLKDWLIMAFGSDYKIIATSNHKFITFTIDSFIFKCSYKLSNKSLAKFCKDMNTEHQKIKVESGFYDAVTYQDDTLTKLQLKYQYTDVIALKEAVLEQMRIYNDTLATIPLTATGYIRRELRREYKKSFSKNRRDFLSRQLDIDLYKLNREAFAGGYTHGNRFMKNQTIEPPAGCTIRHRDFVSHYPSILRCMTMPVGKWIYLMNARDDKTIPELLEYTDEYHLLINIRIENMTIRKGITMPYAQYSKFYLGSEAGTRFICDNGRVLVMDGKSDIVCTDLDIRILRQQYTFSYDILSVYASRKGKLPQFILDTTDTFFHGKSEYKAVVEDLKHAGFGDFDSQVLEANTNLMKSKNGLNSLYGCTSTDPVQSDMKMSAIDGKWSTVPKTDKYIRKKLKEYYKSNNNTLSYSFGVFCTSWARYLLFMFLNAIGYDNAIYCDTDSCFYISTPENEAKIAELNNKLRADAETNGWYITNSKGKKVYYSYFADEDENITKFRFLHSKCYCYIEDNGREHLTVAGVTALSRDGKTNRMQELGNINNLQKGFIFKACGGVASKYIEGKPRIENINGHLTEVAASCIIVDNTKTLDDRWDNVDIEYIEEWSIDESEALKI